MKLRDYIKTEKLTYEAFAAMVPPYSVFTIRSWAQGLRMPRPDAMALIQEATGGAVAPVDFYNMEDAA